MSVQDATTNAQSEFQKAITHLKAELAKLQAGRANPALVESLSVESYGTMQPMKAVASITIPDPRTIQIQPWDKSMIMPIEKAIISANTGLNPNNDGNVVRISIPPLTEERRRDLTKHVGKLAEEAKITVRNARQSAINHFKKLKTDSEITEDDLHSAEKKLQDKVGDANKDIEEIAKNKEKDIMTI